MYTEETVKSIEQQNTFVLLVIGRYIAKPPLGCLLVEGQTVQIDIDPYKGTLMNIASEACFRCPLKGNSCRYGIDAYK